MSAIGHRREDGSPGGGTAGELGARLGLTVPHEWWPSAPLLKSFEAAGFGYVQVDSPPASVLRDARLLTRHAAALAESLETTGLGCVLHAPSGLRVGTADCDRAMDGLLGYAAEAGAEIVVYHALALPDAPGSEGRLRSESVVLGRVARRAAALDIRIAVENLCPPFPGPEVLSWHPMRLRELVRRIGGDGIGLCLDLGHAHVSAELGRTSLVRLVEPVLDAVCLFHAHDNFGARRASLVTPSLGVDPLRLDLHLPPGRGTLPWHDISPLVARHDAPVVLEVHPPYRPPAADLAEDAALMLDMG